MQPSLKDHVTTKIFFVVSQNTMPPEPHRLMDRQSGWSGRSSQRTTLAGPMIMSMERSSFFFHLRNRKGGYLLELPRDYTLKLHWPYGSGMMAGLESECWTDSAGIRNCGP